MSYVLFIGNSEEKRNIFFELSKELPMEFISSLDKLPEKKPDLVILEDLEVLKKIREKYNDELLPFITVGNNKDLIKEQIRSFLKIKRFYDEILSELKQKRQELQCLFQISTLREKTNITLEEITQEIANIISSLKLSEGNEICARIFLGYQEFRSDNFFITPWKYASDIIIDGEWGGTIEIYYSKKPESFKEKDLIDAISERLGRIAERFKAEESLKFESRNIKNILNAMKDLIYKVNENYEIEYINPAMEKEFGPAGGKKCYEYFGRRKICESCPLPEVLKGKTLRRERYFEDRKKIYDVLETPVRNPDGTVSMLSILRDLTELKRAHMDLMEKEELHRKLTESVADGVILVQDGKIIFANKAFSEIFEFENTQELIGTEIKSLFDKDFHALCKKVFDPYLLPNAIEPTNWLLGKTKRGKKIWVAINRSIITLKSKPAILATFRDVTEQVMWERKIQEETEYFRRETIKLRSTLKDRYKFGELIGKSPAMQQVYELILKAADSDASVVILGESGTGKELVARAIHKLSKRANKPFIAVNCGAIPEQLVESEFFGHKKGSFTGAYTDKHGYLYVVNGGTLFLDEVGELNTNIQVKFLRALETGEYSPIGDTNTYKSDFRLICATNRDLAQLVREGKMREDFYYRISVIPIFIPPLRERKEDIPLLVEHFLKVYSKGKHPPILPAKYMDLLMSYDWPGNVRELQAVIQRYLAVGTFDFMNKKLNEPSVDIENFSSKSLRQAVDEFEKQIILKTLNQNRWHRGKTASALGIDPKTLYRKMKRYGILA